MQELEYKPRLTLAHTFSMLGGVILPTISITLEATTHICAETFFDPIPSMWYLMLVIFVPVAQLHVWFTIARGTPKHLARAGWLNALVLGISLFYSFVYIPLLPLAALTLIFIVGFLPLAPFFSLGAAIVMRRQLTRIAARTPQKNFIMRKVGLFTAFLITAVFIGLLELPASLTRYGLKLAASQVPETRAKGIRFLHNFGSKDYLLRACYGRSGWATDIFGYFVTMKDPVTPTEAQQIYYRVTGETFDTSHPPRRTGGRINRQDEFDFDPDQGGTKISGKLTGLSLSNSKIHTAADAEGGVAYMQWTMAFRNEWVTAREARAEVQLPPGAVVSRLTLWVNGEEREAAFAGRNRVREAYQQIAIEQRRDPVLVTTSGRDRILVQCYPVHGEGGEMKIRIGITIPLLLENLHYAQLLFPHFVDRNFSIPDNLHHGVSIESKTAMSTTSRAFTTGRFLGESFAQSGNIPERDMSKPETSILFGRANVPTWSQDPFQTSNFIIQQTIDARGPSHLYRIVLVVDTSQAMEEMRHQIVTALRAIPPEFDVKLVLADAEGLSHNDIAYNVEDASVQLDNAVFSGGADNVPALLKAWGLAAEKPGNNAIVWVHSPQLLQIQSTDALRQLWESGPYGPAL